MDVLKLADRRSIFAKIVGESMEAFPLPKPRTIERFNAAHGIKPIIARPVAIPPIAAKPITAMPISTAPGKHMTPSSSSSDEDSQMDDVKPILEEVATGRAECPKVDNTEPIVIDSDTGETPETQISKSKPEGFRTKGPRNFRTNSLEGAPVFTSTYRHRAYFWFAPRG